MRFFAWLFGLGNGPEAQAFVMKVVNVVPLSDGCAAVTGLCEAGAVVAGDTVFFTSLKGEPRSARVGVQVRGSMESGEWKAGPGANISFMLSDVSKECMAAGTMLYGVRR
jgi:translation elongation factor EF-Tu-like GTPase